MFDMQHAVIVAGIAFAAIVCGLAIRAKRSAVIAASLLSFVVLLPLVQSMEQVKVSDIGKANLHMSKREYAEALKIFKHHSRDLDSAECCMHLGDDEGAFFYTRRPLLLDSASRNRAHLIRGLILKKRGDTEGAMGEFIAGQRGGDMACSVHVDKLKRQK